MPNEKFRPEYDQALDEWVEAVTALYDEIDSAKQVSTHDEFREASVHEAELNERLEEATKKRIAIADKFFGRVV